MDELLPLADIACMPSCPEAGFCGATSLFGDDPMAACDICKSLVDETHLAAQSYGQQEKKVKGGGSRGAQIDSAFVLIGADQTVNFLRKLESLKTSVLTKMIKNHWPKALDGIEQVLKEGENIKDDFKNKKGI